MEERRRSQRVNYLATSWLHNQKARYFCRLENISLHGALVDLKKTFIGPVRHGDTWRLRLHQDAEGQRHGDVMVQVVRFESAVVGLEFIAMEDASKDVLETIIRKERHLSEGAAELIRLARETAELRGIELTDVHFDKGELIPEREIHTLRLSAGGHASTVHLHRAAIEEFHAHGGAVPARGEIHKAIGRLER